MQSFGRMKTSTKQSTPPSSSTRLTIKSGLKGGIRIGGHGDMNHNQTRLKLTVRSGLKGGIRIAGHSDLNHNHTQLRR